MPEKRVSAWFEGAFASRESAKAHVETTARSTTGIIVEEPRSSVSPPGLSESQVMPSPAARTLAAVGLPFIETAEYAPLLRRAQRIIRHALARVAEVAGHEAVKAAAREFARLRWRTAKAVAEVVTPYEEAVRIAGGVERAVEAERLARRYAELAERLRPVIEKLNRIVEKHNRISEEIRRLVARIEELNKWYEASARSIIDETKRAREVGDTEKLRRLVEKLRRLYNEYKARFDELKSKIDRLVSEARKLEDEYSRIYSAHKTELEALKEVVGRLRELGFKLELPEHREILGKLMSARETLEEMASTVERLTAELAREAVREAERVRRLREAWERAWRWFEENIGWLSKLEEGEAELEIEKYVKSLGLPEKEASRLKSELMKAWYAVIRARERGEEEKALAIARHVARMEMVREYTRRALELLRSRLPELLSKPEAEALREIHRMLEMMGVPEDVAREVRESVIASYRLARRYVEEVSKLRRYVLEHWKPGTSVRRLIEEYASRVGGRVGEMLRSEADRLAEQIGRELVLSWLREHWDELALSVLKRASEVLEKRVREAGWPYRIIDFNREARDIVSGLLASEARALSYKLGIPEHAVYEVLTRPGLVDMLAQSAVKMWMQKMRYGKIMSMVNSLLSDQHFVEELLHRTSKLVASGLSLEDAVKRAVKEMSKEYVVLRSSEVASALVSTLLHKENLERIRKAIEARARVARLLPASLLDVAHGIVQWVSEQERSAVEAARKQWWMLPSAFAWGALAGGVSSLYPPHIAEFFEWLFTEGGPELLKNAEELSKLMRGKVDVGTIRWITQTLTKVPETLKGVVEWMKEHPAEAAKLAGEFIGPLLASKVVARLPGGGMVLLGLDTISAAAATGAAGTPGAMLASVAAILFPEKMKLRRLKLRMEELEKIVRELVEKGEGVVPRVRIEGKEYDVLPIVVERRGKPVVIGVQLVEKGRELEQLRGLLRKGFQLSFLETKHGRIPVLKPLEEVLPEIVEKWAQVLEEEARRGHLSAAASILKRIAVVPESVSKYARGRIASVLREKPGVMRLLDEETLLSLYDVEPAAVSGELARRIANLVNAGDIASASRLLLQVMMEKGTRGLMRVLRSVVEQDIEAARRLAETAKTTNPEVAAAIERMIERVTRAKTLRAELEKTLERLGEFIRSVEKEYRGATRLAGELEHAGVTEIVETLSRLAERKPKLAKAVLAELARRDPDKAGRVIYNVLVRGHGSDKLRKLVTDTIMVLSIYRLWITGIADMLERLMTAVKAERVKNLLYKLLRRRRPVSVKLPKEPGLHTIRWILRHPDYGPFVVVARELERPGSGVRLLERLWETNPDVAARVTIDTLNILGKLARLVGVKVSPAARLRLLVKTAAREKVRLREKIVQKVEEREKVKVETVPSIETIPKVEAVPETIGKYKLTRRTETVRRPALPRIPKPRIHMPGITYSTRPLTGRVGERQLEVLVW